MRFGTPLCHTTIYFLNQSDLSTNQPPPPFPSHTHTLNYIIFLGVQGWGWHAGHCGLCHGGRPEVRHQEAGRHRVRARLLRAGQGRSLQRGTVGGGVCATIRVKPLGCVWGVIHTIELSTSSPLVEAGPVVSCCQTFNDIVASLIEAHGSIGVEIMCF